MKTQQRAFKILILQVDGLGKVTWEELQHYADPCWICLPAMCLGTNYLIFEYVSSAIKWKAGQTSKGVVNIEMKLTFLSVLSLKKNVFIVCTDK